MNSLLDSEKFMQVIFGVLTDYTEASVYVCLKVVRVLPRHIGGREGEGSREGPGREVGRGRKREERKGGKDREVEGTGRRGV